MTIEAPAEQEALKEAASGWVVRLNAGIVAARDVRDFTAWAGTSDAHRKAFVRAKLDLHILKEALVAAESQSRYPREVRPLPPIGRRAALSGALAAASAGGAYWLGSRPFLHLWPSIGEMTADFRTQTGERRVVELPGTPTVEMNTRTSLSRLSPQSFELISGEIAINASTPVRVGSAHGWASAENALFSLWNNDGRVIVTCIDGETRVVTGNASATMRARQQVAYGGGLLGTVSNVNSEAVTAWRKGLLIFENTALADAIAQINRYRTGKIFLARTSLDDFTLNATFRLDKIGDAAPKIAEVFHLRLTELPGRLTILS